MMDPVSELKVRAEILGSRLHAGDAASIARLRALLELRRADERTLAARAPELRYKHCLAVVARELGFSGWDHARRVLSGDPAETDFGTMLYPPHASAVLHVWFASHAPARAELDRTRSEEGRRYLLAYRRHFFLAEPPFIEALGMGPDDPDWAAIDWDWGRPASVAARTRLYQRRLAALREAS